MKKEKNKNEKEIFIDKARKEAIEELIKNKTKKEKIENNKLQK